MISSAKAQLESALAFGVDFSDFGELLALKEVVARLETKMAKRCERFELEEAGCSASTAYRIERRASYYWPSTVPVEHQDVILSALERLSAASKRRSEIYDACAAEAPHSSVKATHDLAKRLVREENEALAKDPFEAKRQRRFTLRSQDEHGGCSFYGYVPAATAGLLKGLMDRAFKADKDTESDSKRTLEQRRADALDQVLRWASSERVASTGHCSLVVSVVESDEFDWRAKFATNVGIDLNLFDIVNLSGDWISDYIVVHDHTGAVKKLVTGERSANFNQRVALLARDLVCQHPGCNAPASECDAHHVVPWQAGGRTSVDNLAYMCRKHHSRNDDSWKGNHVEIKFGRPVSINYHGIHRRNRSPAARRSGASRLTNS